jgi:hypothetical protein
MVVQNTNPSKKYKHTLFRTNDIDVERYDYCKALEEIVGPIAVGDGWQFEKNVELFIEDTTKAAVNWK